MVRWANSILVGTYRLFRTLEFFDHTGWQTAEMVRRYAHFSSEHLSQYVDRLATLQVVIGDKGATDQLRSAE